MTCSWVEQPEKGAGSICMRAELMWFIWFITQCYRRITAQWTPSFNFTLTETFWTSWLMRWFIFPSPFCYSFSLRAALKIFSSCSTCESGVGRSIKYDVSTWDLCKGTIHKIHSSKMNSFNWPPPREVIHCMISEMLLWRNNAQFVAAWPLWHITAGSAS